MSSAPIFDSPAWVGNALRHTRCWQQGSGYALHIEGAGLFSIPDAGDQPTQVEPAPHPVPGLAEEVLHAGPARVLSLALQDVWCLHGSGVLYQGQALIFIGESGWGKSTLAAYFEHHVPGSPRLADDILPVLLQDTGLHAWPSFPQLKLAPAERISPLASQFFPVSAIFQIVSPADAGDGISSQQLHRYQGSLTLLSGTAGARLFGPELLKAHLAFCSQAAAQVPVYRLAYPRRLELLPEVVEYCVKLVEG